MYSSWKNAAKSFLIYSASNVTYKRTVYRIVEKFRMTGSVMGTNKIRKSIAFSIDVWLHFVGK
jgi:glucan phosphoethanolaminetransferase (alkaline phosphatase superfamily)